MYFELCQFSDFHCGHFFKFKMATDTTPVVINTTFNMKLYITKYIWLPNFVRLSSVYSEICLIIDIQDDHFKVQDGGQVSCRYQFHTNPYIIKCMCANFVS